MRTVGSVNVNGIRAAAAKGLDRWLAATPADVVCLQEARAERAEIPAGLLDGWHLHPGVDGPYSWWSYRGRAFDNDAGWRIDLHVATPGLAAGAVTAVTGRAPSHAERWSDHAPVTVRYAAAPA